MGESGTGRGEREAGWGKRGRLGESGAARACMEDQQKLRGAEGEPEEPRLQHSRVPRGQLLSPRFPAELWVGLGPRPRPHVGPPGSH